MGVIEEKAKGMRVKEQDKRFMADFYKYAFVGIMLDWIKNDMKEDPKNIINSLSLLIHGQVSRALENYEIK